MKSAVTEAKLFGAFAVLLTLVDLVVGFSVSFRLGYDHLWAAAIVTVTTIAFAFGLATRHYWAFQFFIAILLLVNVLLVFALFPPFGFDQDSPLISTQTWKLVAYTLVDLGICWYVYRNRGLMKKGMPTSSGG